ncbi:hypothetical protein Asi02nite_04940 [Asanoa siamensis]|uniref:Uncharacterized protein n=2 Tax=Asanoa siamensis TaxID=926357 RepID=A0ABQ4CI87_9ACTN|nr:hypothetical protein Asi02nite_04940 [Asanoa siamensis]
MRASNLRRIAAEQAALLRTLRTATPSPAKVTGIWCQSCRRWRKPSKFAGSSAHCTTCTAIVAALARRVRERRV